MNPYWTGSGNTTKTCQASPNFSGHYIKRPWPTTTNWDFWEQLWDSVFPEAFWTRCALCCLPSQERMETGITTCAFPGDGWVDGCTHTKPWLGNHQQQWENKGSVWMAAKVCSSLPPMPLRFKVFHSSMNWKQGWRSERLRAVTSAADMLKGNIWRDCQFSERIKQYGWTRNNSSEIQ